MTGTTLRSEPRRRSCGRRRSAWSPKRLSNLRAWYDAELGQPKYSGVGAYVQLDGASTDNIFTLDSVATSFSNDIEVIMRVNVTDWTAAANQTLCGKYLTTGNQRSWRFYISTTGTIGLTASVNGTAVTSVIVTPTVPFVDGTWYWLRLRLGLSNGANSVATVDYAADTGSNTDVPTVWTANGSNTGATIASVFNSTGSLEIGSFTNGTLERLTGRVGRVIVNDGFSGPTVADFNASDCYGPGYTQGLPTTANGSKYVQLYGRSGDYIYTADKASLQITGPIEVVMRLQLPDYTPLSAVTLIGKFPAAPNRSWRIYLNTNGTLAFQNSTDGTTLQTNTSTQGIDAFHSDGATIWIKATLIPDNGAIRVVEFFTAADQLAEPTSWTQLGSTLVGTVGAMFAGTAPLEISGRQGGVTELFTGRVFRAIVRNGIGGTTVADYNAQNARVNGEMVDAYTNEWRVNNPKAYRWDLGLPKIYDRSGNNVAPATFGSGSNQPLWLPWDGRSQVHLPGVVGNNVASSRSKGTVSTSIQYVYCMDDMVAPSATSTAMSWGTGGSYGVLVYHNTDLRPRVFFGGAAPQDTNVMGVAPPTGTRWWRITWTIATGVLLAERSSDATNDPSAVTWTTHASYSGSGESSFSRGAEPIKIGEVAYSAVNPISGLVRRALIAIDGTTVADFNAELCGQSGYTDAYSNMWTVNRSTSGRKTVVQSPTARSARSLILHGTDDWIDVPAAAVPALDTFAAATSVTASFRRWHAPATNMVFNTKASGGSAVLGFSLRIASGLTQITSVVGDGATNDFVDRPDPNTAALGARAVATTSIDNVSPFVTLAVNDGTPGADTSRATTGTTSTAGAGRIGATLAGASAIDMEFEALVCRNAKTSELEHDRLVRYYRGGV